MLHNRLLFDPRPFVPVACLSSSDNTHATHSQVLIHKMGAIKTLTLKLHYAKKQRVNKPVPWYAFWCHSLLLLSDRMRFNSTLAHTSHTGSLVSRRVR